MQIEQTKYEKLFSTPLVRFRVPEHEALNAALLDEGARLRGLSDGVTKSNRGGWHSEGNLFDNDAECIQTLRVLAEESVHEATRKIGAKTDPKSVRRLLGTSNYDSKRLAEELGRMEHGLFS